MYLWLKKRRIFTRVYIDMGNNTQSNCRAANFRKFSFKHARLLQSMKIKKTEFSEPVAKVTPFTQEDIST